MCRGSKPCEGPVALLEEILKFGKCDSSAANLQERPHNVSNHVLEEPVGLDGKQE